MQSVMRASLLLSLTLLVCGEATLAAQKLSSFGKALVDEHEGPFFDSDDNFLSLAQVAEGRVPKTRAKKATLAKPKTELGAAKKVHNSGKTVTSKHANLIKADAREEEHHKRKKVREEAHHKRESVEKEAAPTRAHQTEQQSQEVTVADFKNHVKRVGVTEEHDGLPKLKAWTMMARFIRRLRASLVAYNGGTPEEVALVEQDPAEPDEPSTGQVFTSLLLWAVVATLAAYYYKSSKELPGAEEKQTDGADSFKEWKHGLFSCYEDPEITVCSFCCPAIRWSLTMSYVPGLLTFWTAFFIYLCVELLGGLTAGTLGWFLLAMLCTAYRQQLRAKFNMEEGQMTYITDALAYLCCTCCAIAQEARHVEDALKCGHPALQEIEEKAELNAESGA